ncbi:MAG TPA: universal stress protein [Streptosporangiaceae bacterium]|jgi:nucleotide-binding universal stress UspA family protein|nr:universal stress protein [Streptosporangiaceae bacterium]
MFSRILIVLGRPRRGELATRLLGSVTMRVLRRSSCPVIVPPRREPRRELSRASC